ncbi:MAG TPA: GDP-mannose 4,6-dehydratase [Candidatus Andersenbacteria bacterium]|nr:GDP-mannose 4,6-dehydratase [Candidatus Andersenbacteria bacterium]
MNVLITGGAGFIGSHVAHELLKRGENVVIIDDFNDRYDPRLKEARIKHMFTDTKKPEVIQGNILNQELLEKIIVEHNIDSIIHLAAWASVQPSIEHPLIYSEVNVTGTVSVLEAARKHGIQRLVAASSSSVYGGTVEMPFHEDMDIMHPISPYAATKAATELMCATWNHLYSIPITCLRFFTVYGPWGRPEMALFSFTKAIIKGEKLQMRGKNTIRDFTYIDDIVSGVISSLDRANGYHVYNLGESDGVPLPRMIAALESAIGVKAIIEEVPLPNGDVPATLSDISRAKIDLNYNPTTSIEDGAKKFVAWYRKWNDQIFHTD